MVMIEEQIHSSHMLQGHDLTKTEEMENEIVENKPQETIYQKSIEDNWWKWTDLSQWKNNTAKRKTNVLTVEELDISQKNVQIPSMKAQQVDQEVIVEMHHHNKDKDEILDNNKEENPHRIKGRNCYKFERPKPKATKLKKYATKFEI